MPHGRTAVTWAGIAGGALFFLHALIPYSHAWPLIWPALAGAAAGWFGAEGPSHGQVGRGKRATLRAAAIVGAIGFVGSAITVLALRRPMMNSVAGTSGADGTLVRSAAVLGLFIAAIIAVFVTLIGGAVMMPIRRSHGTPSGPPPA